MIQPASDSGTVNLDCTIMKPLLVEYFFCSFLMLINLNIHLLSYTYKHSSLPSPSQHLTTTTESIIMSKAAPTTMDWWGFEKSQSHPYDSHVTTLIICMVMVHKIWIFKLWLKPVQNWSILLENQWLPEMTSVSHRLFYLFAGVCGAYGEGDLGLIRVWRSRVAFLSPLPPHCCMFDISTV